VTGTSTSTTPNLLFSLAGGSALLATPIAMLATALIASRFRARVAHSMLATSGRADAATLVSPGPSATGKSSTKASVALRDAALDSGAAESTAAQRVRRAVFRLHAIHGCAGLAFAAVATLVVFPAAVHYPAKVYSVTIFFLIFATALAPSLVMLGSRRQGAMLLAIGAWVALIALVGSLFGQTALAVDMWIVWAGVPSAMALLFGARRLRAAGPVLFAATWMLVVAFLGGMMYTSIRSFEDLGIHFVRPDLAAHPLPEAATRLWRELGALPADQRAAAISSIASDWGKLVVADYPERATIGYLALFYARWFAPVALAAAFTWGLFAWYARRYRARRSSDVMLSIDTLWLTYTTGYVLITLMSSPRPWAATAFLVPFVAYKASHALAQRMGAASPGGPTLTLLLLRVFGRDRHTQLLLDELSARWRHLGPIRLIAGTDSIYASLEPHEFYEMVGGRLSRQFIGGEWDLEKRLRPDGVAPDPDGLYRIEGFYCHRDTWQMTVARLLRESDAILMDLRGFSEANEGCVFELRQLVWAAPESCTLLVDTATNLQLLETTVRAAWKALPSDAPNADERAPTLRLFHAHGNTQQIVRALLPALAGSTRRTASTGSTATTTR
jgi:hypothetical protein